MNLLARWGKFNLVGAMGTVVQLGSLAALSRVMGGHYLVATAAALEITLLHNFVWHLHYTWRDRRDRRAMARQLVRFHLSNGMVSLVGNLGLMRLLVGDARLPLLVANGIAILVCSVVNFTLGHTWAFASIPHLPKPGRAIRLAFDSLRPGCGEPGVRSSLPLLPNSGRSGAPEESRTIILRRRTSRCSRRSGCR
jgi:putative flippase GtrA